MRPRNVLLMLAAGAAVVAIVLAVPEAPPPVEDAPTATGPAALAAVFSPETAAGACSACHFGWDRPFDVNATRRILPDGNASYRVRFAPVSAYNLTLVAVAARHEGDGLPDPVTEETVVTVNGGVGTESVPFTVPWDAAAVLVEAYTAYSYERAEVILDAATPTTAAAGEGSRVSKQARLGPTTAGTIVEARLGVPDAIDQGTPVIVRFHAWPVGYEVASATRGFPADVTWTLPPPGRAGAPVRFDAHIVPFNDHPTDRWQITTQADASYYSGNVSVSRPPAAPGNWTVAEQAAAWSDGAVRVLHEETFDGVVTLTRDDRGAWERVVVDANEREPQRVLFGTVPPPSTPMAPPPPGTRLLRVTLEWEGRTPLSPAPTWQIAVTHDPLPDFRYPEPVETSPGRLVVEAPLTAADWGEGDAGTVQAIPLLVLREGRAEFDGSYRFLVEAVP